METYMIVIKTSNDYPAIAVKFSNRSRAWMKCQVGEIPLNRSATPSFRGDDIVYTHY